MTEDEFLARCANAYRAGLLTPERRQLLERWVDFVLRFEGGQMGYAVEFLACEHKRLNGFIGRSTLANDSDGYALMQFAAILVHPCQKCATDPQAWWTRAAFCEHQGDDA